MRKSGALCVLAGSIAGPLATPALIWVTIAANLPLALVIAQLFAMAVISNWLSRIAGTAGGLGSTHADPTERPEADPQVDRAGGGLGRRRAPGV
jgi:hypothetical protein